jgi:hypothetical protein
MPVEVLHTALTSYKKCQELQSTWAAKGIVVLAGTTI